MNLYLQIAEESEGHLPKVGPEKNPDYEIDGVKAVDDVADFGEYIVFEEDDRDVHEDEQAEDKGEDAVNSPNRVSDLGHHLVNGDGIDLDMRFNHDHFEFDVEGQHQLHDMMRCHGEYERMLQHTLSRCGQVVVFYVVGGGVQIG